MRVFAVDIDILGSGKPKNNFLCPERKRTTSRPFPRELVHISMRAHARIGDRHQRRSATRIVGCMISKRGYDLQEISNQAEALYNDLGGPNYVKLIFEKIKSMATINAKVGLKNLLEGMSKEEESRARKKDFEAEEKRIKKEHALLVMQELYDIVEAEIRPVELFNAVYIQPAAAPRPPPPPAPAVPAPAVPVVVPDQDDNEDEEPKKTPPRRKSKTLDLVGKKAPVKRRKPVREVIPRRKGAPPPRRELDLVDSDPEIDDDDLLGLELMEIDPPRPVEKSNSDHRFRALLREQQQENKKKRRRSQFEEEQNDIDLLEDDEEPEYEESDSEELSSEESDSEDPDDDEEEELDSF